uniref:Phosphatidylethanolamine-binding protein n=1 Tax=Dendroctonus ponderosae TaxID=77166 RepID=A0AAR5PTH2_DENPD
MSVTLLVFLCGLLIESCIAGNENAMVKEQIVPEIVDTAPNEVAEITYPSGAKANMGKILTPTQVMVDPDAPSRANPFMREWNHWIVGNVPGDDISKGEVLTAFVSSGPPKDSGLHRYVIFIYKQDKELSFDEPRLPNNSADQRANFSVRNFAKKYNLEGPIAGNFYLAEWDSHVPIVHKQLGIDNI